MEMVDVENAELIIMSFSFIALSVLLMMMLSLISKFMTSLRGQQQGYMFDIPDSKEVIGLTGEVGRG